MLILRSGPLWSGLKVPEEYTIQEYNQIQEEGGNDILVMQGGGGARPGQANDGNADRGPVLKVSEGPTSPTSDWCFAAMEGQG